MYSCIYYIKNYNENDKKRTFVYILDCTIGILIDILYITASKRYPNVKKSKDNLERLTKIWYDKLKDEGFEDIEWFNPKQSGGQNTPYLKDSALNYKRRYNEFTAKHYQIMQNFCTFATFPSKKHRYIIEFYTEGITFREIIKKMRKLGYGWTTYRKGVVKKPNLSLFSLHHLIKKYILLAYQFNTQNVNGLDYNPLVGDQHVPLKLK